MAIKKGNSLANSIVGTSLADQLFGLGGNDTLTGSGGNDLLDGGTGTDRMSGGTGNDTYVVDRSTDTVIESSSQGTDTVRSSVSLTIGVNVEHLVLTGSANANGTLSSSTNEIGNSITGNGGANRLNGGLGHDVLSGGLGSDILMGGNGNDTLLPGAGNGIADTIIGGNGFDTVDYRDALTGVLVELSNPFTLTTSTDRGASGDVISSVESVSGSRFNDVLRASTEQFSNAFGGAGNDQILGSSANYDRLRGDDGNDQLIGLSDSNEDFVLQYGRGMDIVIGYRQNNDEDHILIHRAEFGLSTLPGGSIATVEYRIKGAGDAPLFTGQQRLAFHTPTSTLWADKDGAGSKFEPIVVAVFDSTSEPPQNWNIFVI